MGYRLGTGWAQSKIGSAGAASLAEKPELSSTIIIMLAIPETMIILGFVVAIISSVRAAVEEVNLALDQLITALEEDSDKQAHSELEQARAEAQRIATQARDQIVRRRAEFWFAWRTTCVKRPEDRKLAEVTCHSVTSDAQVPGRATRSRQLLIAAEARLRPANRTCISGRPAGGTENGAELREL